MAWAYGQWRRSAASPLPLAALLHAATALVLLLLLCAGHARADTSTAPIAAAAAGDKAAADRSSMGRPRLVDGGFPAMAAARHWVLGDKAYIGMLAGHDVETKLCDPTVGSQAGYFKIAGSKDTNYFYWFFESRSNPDNDPVIVWLTGGPGCSSILALLSENGPCFVNANGTDTIPNPYSWNSNANILWVDQPPGVGFSYASKADPVVDTEVEVGEDLYNFLQSFFAANPRFAKQPFYLFGESYGGHYIPAVGHKIFTANQELGKDGQKQDQQQQRIHINLKGLGIGNGLVDPEIQYQYYGTYAQNNSYGIELVSADVAHKMDRAVPRCASLIHSCQHAGATACALARVFCTARILDYFPLKDRNIYDIRGPCRKPPLCYDFDNVEAFLKRPEVLAALHVAPEAGPWQPCSDQVMQDFLPDVMRNYHQLLVPLLEGGVKVLAYGGDADFICNVFGIEAWTEALEWRGHEGFRAAPGRVWQTAGGQPAGIIRSHDGLTYLRVFESGHMVPLDQPAAALEMLNAFIGSDPQALQLWDTAIREGRPESTRAPTPAITAAAAAAATNAAAAPAAPANSDPNKSNRAARALRGKKGSGVVVEQELAAAPGLA